jgi:sugar O-acyltransferase (sialic acid O-acetyltransferase NeuD family)
MVSNAGAQRIVIIGAGGFAREVLDVYEACNATGNGPYEVLGFVADHPDPGTLVNDLPVLGPLDWLNGRSDLLAICAIGDTGTRRVVVREAAHLGVGFHTIVHPDAKRTRWIEVGIGTVITAGCILTNRIRVGDHVHLNIDSTIGHDVVIGDFVTIAPGVHVSGNVILEPGCNVGTGAVIIQGRRIGAGSVIGAGAVVTTDIPADSVAVGVPAKVIKTREPRWQDRS